MLGARHTRPGALRLAARTASSLRKRRSCGSTKASARKCCNAPTTAVQLGRRSSDLSDDGAHVLRRQPGHARRAGRHRQPANRRSRQHHAGRLARPHAGAERRSFTAAASSAQAAQWRPGYHWIAATDASRVYFQVQPDAANRHARPSTAGGLLRAQPRSRTVEPGKRCWSPAEREQRVDPRDARRARGLLRQQRSQLDPADTNEPRRRLPLGRGDRRRHLPDLRVENEAGETIRQVATTAQRCWSPTTSPTSISQSTAKLTPQARPPARTTSTRSAAGRSASSPIANRRIAAVRTVAVRTRNCRRTATCWSSRPRTSRAT